jgi:hypothetical protein
MGEHVEKSVLLAVHLFDGCDVHEGDDGGHQFLTGRHGGGDGQYINLAVARQHQDAFALLLVAELGLRHDHARGDDAAQLGVLDGESAHEHGPGKTDGDGLSGGYVRCAADDGAQLLLPDVDGADRQVVGVRMRGARGDLPPPEAPGRRRVVGGPRLQHPLHLGPGQREPGGKLLSVERDGDVIAEP